MITILAITSSMTYMLIKEWSRRNGRVWPRCIGSGRDWQLAWRWERRGEPLGSKAHHMHSRRLQGLDGIRSLLRSSIRRPQLLLRALCRSKHTSPLPPLSDRESRPACEHGRGRSPFVCPCRRSKHTSPPPPLSDRESRADRAHAGLDYEHGRGRSPCVCPSYRPVSPGAPSRAHGRGRRDRGYDHVLENLSCLICF